MKRTFFAVLVLLVILLAVSACAGGGGGSAAAPPSPTPDAGPGGVPGDKPADSAAPTPQATEAQKKNIYDPSIFIIEASGDWKQEIAAGYFVNYHVDLYLHKIDANDNRRTEGSYDGVFYVDSAVDAEGYIGSMLQGVPVDITFAVGGEAVADNFGIYLNTSEDKAWADYSILDENGNALPLTQDTPVSRGSFVAVARNIYLEAHAQGAQGERVDYEDAKGTGEAFDINYVVHVAPDSAEANGTRKVTIQLYSENFSQVIEGTMRRIPGYPEDVSDYLNSQEFANNPARAKLSGE
ncbi:MAG: hypothetical protein ABFC62_02575 [Clostridiaceae bacterium]|nr:hypothetical protein [Eubacteriales bacterium]